MKKPPTIAQSNPVVGSLKTQEEKQHQMELMRKLHQQKKDAEKPKPQIVQRKVKKLLRRTFNVGKDKYRPKIGVLLPNRTIRNNVTTKSFMIKQKPISEIRKFLIQQGFIKVGSTAPTDVLRKIYESVAMIDGDVKNHNPDNLLYNFFKSGADKH
jgi:aspartyl/asparaginyl-tRNA synthetase